MKVSKATAVSILKKTEANAIREIGFTTKGDDYMARPRAEIDKTEFEKLCALQCTCNEIAGWFNCSVDTIDRWCKREYGLGFADTFEQKRTKGKTSLRRAQFRLAEKNAAMAIFLGKNYLGQSDKQSVELSGDAALSAEDKRAIMRQRLAELRGEN